MKVVASVPAETQVEPASSEYSRPASAEPPFEDRS